MSSKIVLHTSRELGFAMVQVPSIGDTTPTLLGLINLLATRMKKPFQILTFVSLGWMLITVAPGRIFVPDRVLAATAISPHNLKHLDYTLYVGSDSTFYQVVQQASLVAAQQVQQSFASDEGVQELTIAVLCDRQGQVAPLLFGQIKRQDWNLHPDIQQWTHELTLARYVLGFESSASSSASPSVAPVQPSLDLRDRDE